MSKESKKSIVLSTPQIEFFRTDEKYTLFCGGLGGGKTYCGAMWAITMALRYPEANGLITANSYSQLKKATLAEVFMILTELGIDYKYKSQDGILEIGDAQIFCLSMEKYDLLRGIEVGWAWSDECAFYKEDAFNVLQGRIRGKRGPLQWKGTTTPNGFNWLYTKFVERPLKSSKVVYATTMDNAENLGDDYVESLRGMYDSRLAAQELDGQFVNLNSGKVYYGFDRNKHVKQTNFKSGAIYVGLDFNVHPLCGIFCTEKNGELHIVDELYLEDSNTFKAAKEIIAKYPMSDLRVVADDSGSRRKTSSNTTDHEIIRRAHLNLVDFRNPLVKDRYNNTNRLFDQNKIIIDPKCKRLIEDLEKLTYDNKDPMLSHVSDALGYALWHLKPFKKPRRETKVRYY